ncbi:MAG: FAD-binding oxidoreductase [Hyphomicrobiaceae bacterium]
MPRPPSPELIDRFAAITGERYAIREAGAQSAYLREWRDLFTGQTPLVLRPGSTAEVSAILALAAETGTAIVPQGGNTGLVGGQIPSKAGEEIVLSLSRLDRVRALDPAGDTITVEAGCTLEAVQRAAETAGRLFPLSLASQGSCQIGGNISTNAGGVQVLAYGNTRDLVLGLEVVLADGRVWDGLRALRKDNTGYHLKDIFIGAEGTLGVVTAAVLKLFPRPAERVTAIAGLPSLEAVRDVFARMRAAAGPALTAFEVMPRLAIEFVNRHVPGTRDPLSAPHAWYALVELSGHVADGHAARTMETVLAAAIEAGEVEDAAIAATLQQSADLWRLRETLSDTQKQEGGSIKHDVAVPVEAIPELIARGNARMEALMPGIRPLPFGHFGDGNIHYNVSQPVGMDKARFLEEWDRFNDVIYEIVRDLGGSISAEHGIGRLKVEDIAMTKSEVEMDLMRRLKAAFDPAGILNPGKVL